MTQQEHDEIFAKEVLTIKDIMKLFACAYPTASEQIRKMKTKLEFSGKALRLDMQGRIHKLDYFDYIGVKDPEKYIGA